MSLSEDVLNFMLMQKAMIGVPERFLLKSEVSMRKLISKKVYKVERLWCYKRYYDANITGLLYLKTRKFLWWDLKPILYIDVKVPYIDEPFYDGEYGTNRRLSSLEVQMRAEMEVIKDKFQRRLDRLVKRKSRA